MTSSLCDFQASAKNYAAFLMFELAGERDPYGRPSSVLSEIESNPFFYLSFVSKIVIRLFYV